MRPSTQLDEARAVVRRLIEAGELLPGHLRDQILDLGDGAVPALIAILEDDELALSRSPGGGWAPTHAARLLGEMRAADAVGPMLRVLADTDWNDILHDQVIQSLPQIGEPVIEPALRAYAEDERDDFRYGVCAVLAEAGVKDERIFAVLIDQLRRDPGRAANLAIYGDERAVPHLLEELDRYEIVESENPMANHELIELRAAVEDLGGALTAEQQHKCRRGREPAEEFNRKIEALLASRRSDVVPVDSIDIVTVPAEPAQRRHRPGRNEPCWCGSARKYKKCHLAADEGDSFADGVRS